MMMASRELMELVATANLRIRELGFKPYVAPAISLRRHAAAADAPPEAGIAARWLWGGSGSASATV